jgi:hypothetical protein
MSSVSPFVRVLKNLNHGWVEHSLGIYNFGVGLQGDTSNLSNFCYLRLYFQILSLPL